MPLDDAVIPDRAGFLDDMTRSMAPDVMPPAGVLIDRALTLDRMTRKGIANQAQKAAPPPEDDFSSYGIPADQAPTFAEYGDPVGAQPGTIASATGASAPAAPSPEGSLGVVGKGVAQGVVGGLGATMKGLGIATTPGQDMAATAEAARQIKAGKSASEAVDSVMASPPPAPAATATPLYKAGAATQQFGEKQFPLSPTEQESVTGQVAKGVGGFMGMIPAMAAGGLAGGPVGAVIAGSGQMAASSAAGAYDDAIAKGADEATAAKAAGLNAIVGGALGALPLGTVLAPVTKVAPGLAGWAATTLEKAVRSGVAFASIGEAQEYLAREIAKTLYDPKSEYEADTKRIIASLLTGGIVGAVVPHGGGAAEPRSKPEDIDAFIKAARKDMPDEESARGKAWRDEIDEFLRQRAAQEPPAPEGTMRLTGPQEGRGEPPAAPAGEPPAPDKPQPAPVAPKGRLQEDDVLRRYGFDDADIDGMSKAERKSNIAEALKAFGEEPIPPPTGAGKNVPPEVHEDVLKRYGHSDDSIAKMDDKTKSAAVDEAVKSGVSTAPEPPVPGSRDAPVEIKTGQDVATAAAAAAQDYTPAQGEANNIPRGHVKWNGLDITIEAPAGGMRRGTAPDGSAWEHKVGAAYGYIKGTEGADGDHVDVFLGPRPEGNQPVFVLDERDDKTGGFRQHKAFIGFPDHQAALSAYLNSGGKAPEHVGGLRALTNDEFKAWVKDPKATKEPLSASMRALEGEISSPAELVAEEVRESLADGYMDATGGQSALDVAIDNVRDNIKDGPNSPNGAPWADVLKELERRKVDQLRKAAADSAREIDATPAHREAVETALKDVGVDLAEIRPVDVHRAAEIAAEEGHTPSDAFQIAVVRSAVEDGLLTPTEVKENYGPAEATAILDPSSALERSTRASEGRPAVSGETAATEAAGRVQGGGEAGREAAQGRGGETAEGKGGGVRGAERDAERAAPVTDTGAEPAAAERATSGREPATGGAELSTGERGTGGETAKPVKNKPASPSSRTVIPTEKGSLLRYVASQGGLKPSDELSTMGLDYKTRVVTPRGPRQLVRTGGITMDDLAERLVEAQYLPAESADRPGDSGLHARILDMIDDEVRGVIRHVPFEAHGKKSKREEDRIAEENAAREEVLAEASTKLEDAFSEYRIPVGSALPEDMKRAVELIADTDLDPMDAYERAIMENSLAEDDFGRDENYPISEDDRRAFEQPVTPEDRDVPAEESGGGREVAAATEAPVEGGSAPSAGESAGREPEPSAEREPERVAEPAKSEPAREPVVERTAAGEQAVLPGADKIADAELAQRKTDEPLKPKVAQKEVGGLFGDESKQTDLIDLAKGSARGGAPSLEELHGTPLEPAKESVKSATEEVPTDGQGSRELRETAPEVPRERPAGGLSATPERGEAERVPSGGGEPGRGPVSDLAGPTGERQGDAEPAVSGEGEEATKPPADGGRDGARRDREPAEAGLSLARTKIAERSKLNYRITDDDRIGQGGPRIKVRANIDAIRILKGIQEEAREALPEEKAKLVRYVGWGAFAQDIFADRKPEWQAERDQLRALLTPEEFAAARSSTLNAHYTSPEVVKGMWDAMAHLGFKGGYALEPSAGVGHFLGLIPDKVAPKTAWTAVELDPISGGIAKTLYAGADVNVRGFEELDRPSNYFDLAISNVPFGNYNISEKPYGTFPIHDFFFVKALDKIRPGGMVAFITSRYTMDRVDDGTRSLLSKSADLVGAIRLPGGKKGAFSGNAGTEVTTDIMFLRKKVPGEVPFAGKPWADLKEIQTKDGPVSINEYFADNPKMMLGEMRLQGTQYRAGELVLVGNAENLREQINAAAAQMPVDAIMDRGAPPPPRLTADEIDGTVKDGAFFHKGKKVYRREQGTGVEQKLSPADQDKVGRLVGMRDMVNNLLSGQTTGVDANSDVIRRKLSNAYKAFVDKYGPINKEVATTTARLNKAGEPIVITRLPNLSKFLPDPDAWKVAAIENYDRETDTAVPAAIQTKDIIAAPVERDIRGPADALATSLDQTGRIDLDYIAGALDLKSPDEAAHRLGDLIYQNPNGRQWEAADAYLSGDVVKKLEDAKTIAVDAPEYRRNVEALEKVQPEPLTRADITAQFGAPWIPNTVYEDFLKEVIGPPRATVTRTPITGEWNFSLPTVSRDAAVKFGTGRVDATKVINAAFNNRMITVWDDIGEGKKAVNDKETTEARLKTAALKEAFSGAPESGIDGWVWADDARAIELENIYNRSYNNLVQRKYDGSHLTFPGMASTITNSRGDVVPFELRPHQKNAVWRIIQNGNTLLAHVVGSGKSFTMISAGMEMKRLGLVRKPAYAIPNHMLEQFSREFLQAYPNAKILVAQKEEMTRENRRTFLAKVASNEWDGIIITHDAFGRVNMGIKFRKQHILDQLHDLDRVIRAEESRDGKGSATVKDLEKAKNRLRDKLNALMNEGRKDEGVTFEESGIDHLFVDESHLHKNLSFVTRMTRIKGLAQGNAQRAEDLFLKIRYLEQSKPQRSAVFATGTPVSNTMAELWTMQRYLQLDTLKSHDLNIFDSWASTFGQVVENMELSADGRTFKEVASFSKFVNIPELISIYSQIADTQTADMLRLPRPEVKKPNGSKGIEIIEAQASPMEEAYINDLVRRAEEMKGKKAEKGGDNMLKIVTEGRKVATDGRMISPDYGYNPRGKIAHAVSNIFDIWKNGKSPGLVQSVFLDLGTPKSRAAPKKVATDDMVEQEDHADDNTRINLYGDIKQRLIDKGIPANQIAFIHDATDDAKKARLFQKVRAAEVRVLLGSTGKMGVGTNVQDRLYAMHHIDAPWKPAEVEQRDGRIVRQGNMNPDVRILRYVTKRSFDAFMWQKLDTKSKFIGQVLSGSRGSRTAEDIDNPLPEAAEMKAAATGDPRILEHAELDRQVRSLTAQRRSFEASRSRAQWEDGAAKDRLKNFEEVLPSAKADAAKVADIASDKFKVDIGGKSVSERKKAADAILKQLTSPSPTQFYRPTVIKVGTMSGFDMQVQLTYKFYEGESSLFADISLKGDRVYGASRGPEIITPESDLLGMVRRFENILSGIKGQPANIEYQIERDRENIKRLKATIGEKGWPKEAEYRAAAKRLSDLTTEMKAKKEEKPDDAAGGPVQLPQAAEKPSFSLAETQPSRGLTPEFEARRLEQFRAAKGLRPAQYLTPRAVERREALENGLTDLVHAMLGKDNIAGVKFSDQIPITEDMLSGAQAGWGDRTKAGMRAGGVWWPAERVIELAVAGHVYRSVRTAFHEIEHAASGLLYNERERALMDNPREIERMREGLRQRANQDRQTETGGGGDRIDDGFGYLSDSVIGDMSPREIRAETFRGYAQDRASGRGDTGRGLHIGIRMAFNKIMAFLERIRNFLAGHGFRTAEDVFSDLYRGRMAGRDAGPNPYAPKPEFSIVPNAVSVRALRIRGRIAEVFSERGDAVREAAQDLSVPVKRLQDELLERGLSPTGELPGAKDFYTRKRLYPGRLANEIQEFNKTHLDPLVEYMRANDIGLKEAGDYLYAKHAPERNEAIDKINPDLKGDGSGMSDEEAGQIIDKAKRDGKYEALEEVSRRVGDIRNYILDRMEGSGLEHPNVVKAWREKYKNYVDLRGWEDAKEDAPPQFRDPARFNVRGREVKQALGRNSKANNPLVNMLDQAYRTLDRAERNYYLKSVWNAMHGLNSEVPGSLNDIATMNRGEMKRAIDPRTGLVRTVADSGYAMSPNTVALKIGGHVNYIVFKDRSLAEAVKRMRPDTLAGFFQSVLNVQNKIKALWTHYSPEFLLRHFGFRYPIEAIMNSFEQKESGSHNIRQFVRDSIPFAGDTSKAIFASKKGVVSSDPRVAQLQREWEMMRKAGGAMMFRNMRDIDLTNEHLEIALKGLSKNPMATAAQKWRAGVEAMDAITNALDNSLRLAAFHSALKQGQTSQQAALIAREATVDFQLKGRWSNAFGLIWPFANVAVQTGYRMASAVGRSKIMRRVFGGMILAGFMQGAFNYLIGGNDKDGIPFYDKIAPWDRHLNFVLMNPFHRDDQGRPVPIKIPLPYNWALPSTLGHALATLVWGHPDMKAKAVSMVVKAAIEVMTPFGQEHNPAAILAPEITRPIIHIATNENFAGTPIHANPDFQKAPNSWSGRRDIGDRVRTGEGWKYIAEGINAATGGSNVKSGKLDLYPEDIREVFDYFFGAQRRMIGNVMETGKSIGAGKTPDMSHVPFLRVLMGTDFDAADRSIAYERDQKVKKPWTR